MFLEVAELHLNRLPMAALEEERVQVLQQHGQAGVAVIPAQASMAVPEEAVAAEVMVVVEVAGVLAAVVVVRMDLILAPVVMEEEEGQETKGDPEALAVVAVAGLMEMVVSVEVGEVAVVIQGLVRLAVMAALGLVAGVEVRDYIPRAAVALEAATVQTLLEEMEGRWGALFSSIRER